MTGVFKMLSEFKTEGVLALNYNDPQRAVRAMRSSVAFYWPMRNTNKIARARVRSACRVLRELLYASPQYLPSAAMRQNAGQSKYSRPSFSQHSSAMISSAAVLYMSKSQSS